MLLTTFVNSLLVGCRLFCGQGLSRGVSLALRTKVFKQTKVRVNTLNGTGESGDDRAEGWSGRGCARLHRGEPLRCERGCRSDEVRSVGKNEVRAGHGDENTQQAHQNHVANPRSRQRPIYAAGLPTLEPFVRKLCELVGQCWARCCSCRQLNLGVRGNNAADFSSELRCERSPKILLTIEVCRL